MISKSCIKAVMKVILSGFIAWVLFVLVIYFFSGSLKPALPFGILALIGTVTFFWPNYKKFIKQEEEKKKTVGSHPNT